MVHEQGFHGGGRGAEHGVIDKDTLAADFLEELIYIAQPKPLCAASILVGSRLVRGPSLDHEPARTHGPALHTVR